MAASIIIPIIENAPVIIPLIEDGIKLVENLFKNKTASPTEKKEMAVRIINDGLKTYAGIAPMFGQYAGDPQAVIDAIGVAVDAVVNLYNTIGVFVHKPAPVPA